MFSMRLWSNLTVKPAVTAARCASSFRYSDLHVKEAKNKRVVPKGDLGFGKYFTDHMLVVNWSKNEGWKNPEIREFSSFSLSPAMKSLHYAASCFEGFKVMRGRDDICRIFRPEKHLERLRRSASRLCLPDFNADELLQCIKRLIRLDERWVPSGEGEALYVRPLYAGTDPALGVDICTEAMLCILLSPVGSYFSGTETGVALYADPGFVRAWEGGSGAFKLAANYGPTLYVQKLVKEKGCQSTLWLYGPDEKVTEAGTMNIFLFWTNDKGEKELITPPLSGLILPGVTRESILELTKSWNDFLVHEKDVTIHQVLDAIKEKRLHSMFGTGTACVVSPVAKLMYKDKMYEIKGGSEGPKIVSRIYKELTAIQWAVNGPHPWTHPIDKSK